MMDEEKPCCAAAAARKIKKIVDQWPGVGIAQLDEIIDKVAAMNLVYDGMIGRALLKEVKIYNYIPASIESDYRQAIMEEYARRR